MWLCGRSPAAKPRPSLIDAEAATTIEASRITMKKAEQAGRVPSGVPGPVVIGSVRSSSRSRAREHCWRRSGLALGANHALQSVHAAGSDV